MTITPTTKVRLLTGIPLDNTYSHTLTFNSKQEQAEYFAKHSIQDFNNFSYQRWDPKMGRIAKLRIPWNAERLYNVNYIMFQNDTFGDKWFYGFVKTIDYINENVTEIGYEIDVLQTWYFDYTVQDSFVVREHVNDDTKYKHFIEEDLDPGEYLVGDEKHWSDLEPNENRSVIVFACSFTPERLDKAAQSSWRHLVWDTFQGYAGYLYNAITYYAFNNLNSLNIDQFIEIVTNGALAEGILTIFPYPIALWPGTKNPSPIESTKPVIQTWIEGVKQNTSFGSYTPKNNKLFTYPYSFIYCTNNNGTTAEFHYELFNGRIAFAFCGALSCAPDFYMAPMNYKQAGKPGFNWNEGFSTGPSPYCSWVTDTYKAYLAQNQSRLGAQRVEIAANATKGIINATSQALKGKVVSAVESAANNLIDTAMSVYSYEAEQKDRARQPPQASSNAGNELSFALNLRNFHFYNMQITEEYARHIDEYFSMFGYKVLRVKKPNITGRKTWNYVKTENVIIVGNMPADDLSLICDIFNTGVTFWHDKDNVGNYSVDNGIVGGS